MFHDYNQLYIFLLLLLLIVVAPLILLFFANRFFSRSKANKKFENNLPKIFEK